MLEANYLELVVDDLPFIGTIISWLRDEEDDAPISDFFRRYAGITMSVYQRSRLLGRTS